MKENYYITTPIYYASGKLHLGHCTTTVYADCLARFMRQDGKDTMFLTGSDEHGQKIQINAQKAGKQPKQYVDEVVQDFKALWSKLNISYDKFIRTTDEEHCKCAKIVFQKLYDKGLIYKSEYEGLYCTPCESFWTKGQLVDGKCPDCHREVQEAKEESYFFQLSTFADFLRELLSDDKFVKMPNIRNEMLNNFINAGLSDLCVTRTSFDWGIPLDFDPKHVMYVWIDALTNYISALGAYSDDETLMKKYWPANVQIVGKDIARFHSIIWPSILKALDLPLPKRLHAHGWFTVEGAKMGKSLGNAFDINLLIDKYSADAVRHYILRYGPLDGDVPHSAKVFLSSFNSDLSNDLGNLVSRTLAMLVQYRGGLVPAHVEYNDLDKELISECENMIADIKPLFEEQEITKAYDRIFATIRRANKYIEQTTPWTLSKSAEQQERLDTVLATLVETLRFLGIVLQPFLVDTSKKILDALQIPENARTNTDILKFTNQCADKELQKINALFPRLNIDDELKMFENNEKNIENNEKNQKNNTETTKKEEKMEEITENKEQITIDDFAKVDLRIAKVLACEKVEKADKLLKLLVKVGDEERTVVSGIAKYYAPEELVGKKVVLVANLKPVTLRGVESKGMILCASNDDKLSIVSPLVDIDDGAEVR